jgi:hypothetical protein
VTAKFLVTIIVASTHLTAARRACSSARLFTSLRRRFVAKLKRPVPEGILRT